MSLGRLASVCFDLSLGFLLLWNTAILIQSKAAIAPSAHRYLEYLCGLLGLWMAYDAARLVLMGYVYSEVRFQGEKSPNSLAFASLGIFAALQLFLCFILYTGTENKPGRFLALAVAVLLLRSVIRFTMA